MKYPVSEHYDGEVFFNQDPNSREIRTLGDVLRWKLNAQKRPFPPYREGRSQAKLAENDLVPNKAVITFINHATILIQVNGANILTDPVFSKRVSPLEWIGPARFREAGLKISELPKIDFVLLSHNHYDHLDIEALNEIEARFQPKIICPLGNREYFEKRNFKNVEELDWWQSIQISTELKIHLTPAQHWSSRTPTDRNKSLWGGFVVESNDLKIFFSGDTGYYAHFKQIYERFGAMDFSLLPIGSYEPRWFMKDQHVNPHEAVMAHIDLHSLMSIGIHFGTFQLTDEGIDEPARDLSLALKELNVSDKTFVAPDNGETFVYQK